MKIKRIDTYHDNRFSQAALDQHGCFLIDNAPYEIEIVSEYEAVVRGGIPSICPVLIEEFRFYSPHISSFYDEHGCKVKEYPRPQLIEVKLDEIQPSQFYVDEEKFVAIIGLISKAESIVIPVLPHEGRYISLDGHTRLLYAVSMGWDSVRAVMDTSDEWVYRFVDEAKKRGITTPKDLILVSHDEYEEKWDRFCDDFFEQSKRQ